MISSNYTLGQACLTPVYSVYLNRSANADVSVVFTAS